MPGKDDFRPLLADLDEPHSYLSFGTVHMLYLDGPAVLLGVGQTIGLYRFPVKDDTVAQINGFGLIHSLFDVDRVDPSENRGGSLINTDFAIGFAFQLQSERKCLRARGFHRSSHLGDEYLIENPSTLEERVNISFEALEVLFFYTWDHLRAYAGGRGIVHCQPATLGKIQGEAGVEYFGTAGKYLRKVGGLDVKTWDEQGWNPLWEAKAGVELHSEHNPLRILLDFQDGPSQFGQFTDEHVRYFGLAFDFAY